MSLRLHCWIMGSVITRRRRFRISASVLYSCRCGAAGRASISLDYTALPQRVLTKKDGGALSARVELPQRLEAPVAQGQTVGRVVVENRENCWASMRIRAAADAPALDFAAAWKLLWRSLMGTV